jgi:hypothetical protein
MQINKERTLGVVRRSLVELTVGLALKVIQVHWL